MFLLLSPKFLFLWGHKDILDNVSTLSLAAAAKRADARASREPWSCPSDFTMAIFTLVQRLSFDSHAIMENQEGQEVEIKSREESWRPDNSLLSIHVWYGQSSSDVWGHLIRAECVPDGRPSLSKSYPLEMKDSYKQNVASRKMGKGHELQQDKKELYHCPGTDTHQ